MNVTIETGNTDSTEYWLKISKSVNNKASGRYNNLLFNSQGYMYQNQEDYDKALKYYKLALEASRSRGDELQEASVLSEIASVFISQQMPDSAEYYVSLSDNIATEGNFRTIEADNLMIQSQIEEMRGNSQSSLAHYKEYMALSDSILNLSHFSDIANMQRAFDMEKTNEQIAVMALERQIKERTIGYQRMLLIAASLLIVVVVVSLVIMIIRKRQLRQAYDVLMTKNIEILQLNNQEPATESGVQETGTPRKEVSTPVWYQDMPQRIQKIMQDEATICSSDFSINRLSELIEVNRTYVSAFINNVKGKNFRTFLNEHRIQVAQRIFAEESSSRYTIESVAERIGFKSPSAFRDAFKSITGVTPSFYIKSIQNRELQ